MAQQTRHRAAFSQEADDGAGGIFGKFYHHLHHFGLCCSIKFSYILIVHLKLHLFISKKYARVDLSSDFKKTIGVRAVVLKSKIKSTLVTTATAASPKQAVREARRVN